jgi:uncharacterized protein (TIGR04255 family)
VTQGKQYVRPPIDEAVVELLFEPGPAWDGTEAGKLQSELSASYPSKALTQGLFSLSLSPPGNAIPFVPQATTRTLLPDLDGKRMVGVAPNVLTVHELAPYGGWDDFSGRVQEALTAYWKVTQPIGVRRLRIRYINRIVVPSTKVDLDEYFTAAPRLPAGIEGHLRNFITRIEQPFEDGSVMVMTLAPAPAGAPEQESAFVLDFDLVRVFETATAAVSAMAALEELRTRERAAFEAMITDATRRLFV